MNIQKTNDPGVPAEYLAGRIIAELEAGKKVLWFITGGSSITVQILAAKIISEHPHHDLTVTLTDERFGPIGHPDSNWGKTIAEGFSLLQAKLIPILIGESRDRTVENFNNELREELGKADYKIGLFGIGPDGHTAGIIPGTEAVDAEGLSVGYQTPNFERVTMTKHTIERLDEAVVYMQGKEKWPVVKDLEEKTIDIHEQPAQILKKVPLLTIFTDYEKQ